MSTTIDRSQSGTLTALQGKIDGGDAKPRTGSGAAGADGPAPDVATPALLSTVSLASMFASPSLAPRRSGGSEMALAQVAAKLADTREANDLEDVKANQERIRASQEDNAAKLEERGEKIEEAIAQREKSKIGNIFKRIFQAIGAALTYVTAAIVGAAAGWTGVGAVAAGLLFAAAAMQTVQLVDDIAKDATGGLGIAGNIAKAQGKDEEAQRKADTAFGYAVMAASIAFSLAGGVTAFKTVAATLATKVADIAAAANQAGAAASQVSTTVIEAGAAKLQAEATGLKVETEEGQAEITALEDLLDQALARIMQSGEASAAILDGAAAAMKDSADSMSRMRFAT